MTEDADPGIAGEHAFQLFVGIGTAVGDDHHARMQRVTDADAAAVVDGDPCGAARRVQQRIQDRPVGDRVAAVTHAFGFPVRRRDRSGVQMIPADHDRRLETPFAYELVDAETEAGALAVAEPQDARGKALERDTLAREADPAHERFVVSEHFERRIVGDSDVVGVARQRGPTKRTDTATEQRPNIGRDKARV